MSHNDVQAVISCGGTVCVRCWPWRGKERANRLAKLPTMYVEKDEYMDIIASLTESVDGLLFSSEADYPLEPFLWTDPAPFSANRLYTLTTLPESTPITTLKLRTFLAPMLHIDADASEEARTRATRFRALMRLLRRVLTNPTVYKLGTIEMPTFIVGQLTDGSVAGLRTTVVET